MSEFDIQVSKYERLKTRVCRRCRTEKIDEEFRVTRKGEGNYRLYICTECEANEKKVEEEPVTLNPMYRCPHCKLLQKIEFDIFEKTHESYGNGYVKINNVGFKKLGYLQCVNCKKTNRD